MATPLKYTDKGVPKNWDGRDWQTYKWAMQTVFKEKDLADIVEGKLQKAALSTVESEAEFDRKETTITRIVGTSVPPEILHQIRDKTTGSEMWAALCNLFENKDNKTVKAHTIRRLRDDLWSIKFSPGGNINVQMSKMFNLKAELQTVQYTVDDIDMVEMMLESLPNQQEYESLKPSIHYSADCSAFTLIKVRELIRAAASRQQEFRSKYSGGQRKAQKSGGNQSGGNQGGVKAKGDTQNQEKSSDKSSASKKKKAKKCFICESTAHLKADCLERVKNPGGAGATKTEQKRKLRGNVTIRQEVGESSNDEDVDVVTSMLDSMMVDAGVGLGISGEDDDFQEDVSDRETNAAFGSDPVDSDSRQDDATSGGWWYFDTAANVHVTGNRAHYFAFTEDISQPQSVRGLTPALASRIAGVGAVALVAEVDGEQVVLYLDEVFYIPGAKYGFCRLDSLWNKDLFSLSIVRRGTSV